jgi:hypothetical protein
VSDVTVHVSGSSCSNCSALSQTIGVSALGANSYGGSMSLAHVGAYSWSYSLSASSSSVCGATSASDVTVHVSGSSCSNCSSLSRYTGSLRCYGANVHGGSISAAFFGSYSFSYSGGLNGAYSRASANSTEVNRLSINIINARFVDSTAISGKSS